MGGGLGFKRLEAVDKGLPRHHHAELSLILVRAGRAEAWIEGRAAAAGAGDLLVFPAGCVHACRPLPGSPLSYDAYFSDELADLLPEGIRDRILREGAMLRLGAESATLVAAEEGCSPGAGLRLLGRILGEAGLPGACRPLRPGSGGGPGSRPPRRVAGGGISSLESAFELLRFRPAEPRALGKVAADSGYTAKGFIRAFKRRYGMTPHACLVNGRVNLAQRLIARGEPLAEAALAAGFCDQSHLTRQFRAWTGTSPARFRRLSSKTVRVPPR